jgi:hypothetical protein
LNLQFEMRSLERMRVRRTFVANAVCVDAESR